eukprot:jgi/Galph1/2628/GphlegSOOS_G1301.1
MISRWSSAKVRQTFIDFFVQKGHVFYPSSSVVPFEDPTLLFINAGMNQFKPVFLGTVDPSSPLSKIKRACNSQKCIRAGGKHNDLEDVGKDTYHHTFFEMLGNWSFGDYFKTEAIAWALELLTEVFGLPKDRIYATYFGGCEEWNLEEDLEAKNIWLQYLPEERVLPFGPKDNFWEMGDVGPCGPCSEIHFDRIGNRNAAHLVNKDDPSVIEIWNLVFIQFNREADGSLKPLPNKHIDTGMGFERVVSILQGVSSNYDTDVFHTFFAAIQEKTGCRKYTGKIGVMDKDMVDTAYRVVADHVRTLTFAITDGAVPSNSERGYVLRRILRRAVRYGQQFLNAKTGLLSSLVDVVTCQMKDAFPELEKRAEFVKQVVLEEEESFGRTLSKGIEAFNKLAATVEAEGRTIISGADAFFLYDTMGFPLDLTELMARERGLKIDIRGFEEALEYARKVSRADRLRGGTSSTSTIQLAAEQIYFLQQKKVPPTVDDAKYVAFQPFATQVVALFDGKDFQSLENFSKEEEQKLFGIVLEATSFYAESGGQVADTGSMTVKQNNVADKHEAIGEFVVTDVQSYGGYVLHVGYLSWGTMSVGDSDYGRRQKIAPNHTMTHVLNFALRKVFGPTCDQRGSLVDPNKLRFDFAAHRPMTREDLNVVDSIVQEKIDQSLPVVSKVVPLNSALAIRSLRAIFNEQYPDPVRVVAIGGDIDEMLRNPNNDAWYEYSIELCGGTHLNNTEAAEAYVTVEEGGIAKGIRRIVALTGKAAKQAIMNAQKLQDEVDLLKELDIEELNEELSKVTQKVDSTVLPLLSKLLLKDQLQAMYARLLEKKKERQMKIESAAMERIQEYIHQNEDKSHSLVLVLEEIQGDAKLLSKILSSVKSSYSHTSVCLISADEKKQRLVVSALVCPEHIGQGLLAKDWVAASLKEVDGKGGGKNDQAQGQAKVGSEKYDMVRNGADAYAKTILGT